MSAIKVFDSHAHMDCEHFDEDREELFARLQEEIAGLINPGCDNESSLKAISYAEAYDFVYAAVGWHPQEVLRMKEIRQKRILWRNRMLLILQNFIKKIRFVVDISFC